MEGNYFVISNDGQMTAKEMLIELERDSIAPIMVFDRDGVTVVPMFLSKELAQRFAKRNTPKNYSVGSMQARASDIKTIEDNGWVVDVFPWPRKISNIRVEVLELSGKVQVNNAGWRRHM